MAAPASSKLLNIRKNSALQNLIRSNLLRATGTPISQALKSSADSQVPIRFDREVPSVKLNAPTAAEMRKMMNPGLGFLFGEAGLPGMDQSEMILKFNRRSSKVDSDDDEIKDNLDGDDFADDSDDYDDYGGDASDSEYSDGPSGLK